MLSDSETMIPPLAFRMSRCVLSTLTPPIPTAYRWAALYQPSQYRPLLDMSQGVPSAPPSLSVREAVSAASHSSGSYGYCPAEGELVLRKALVDEMKLIYGPSNVDISSNDITLTAGCNMAFITSIMTLADAGDEVILPVPWYFNHQMSLTTLGITPVPLKTSPENGFLPSVEDCQALITSKTKAIALVSPNNPTGAIYPPALLQSFLTLARENKIALIADETYRDFITTGSAPHSIFSSDWRSNFIHLYSFSKSYRVPGHRLGGVVASPAFILHLKTVLDSVQICPPRPIQLALAPLLPSLRQNIAETAAALVKRHELFRDVLPSDWKIGSQGGYYAFVKHPFKGVKSRHVCERLAKEMGVVTLPSAFFCEESLGGEVKEEEMWIRFSVANVDDEKVRQVCERVKECERVFEWDMV